MTVQDASRLISTTFMVLVAGALLAPIDALICNSAPYYHDYWWVSIFMSVSLPMLLVSCCMGLFQHADVFQKGDLARQIAAVAYPAMGAVMLFVANRGSGLAGFMTALFLGFVWGQLAAVVHNHSHALLGRWLNAVRCSDEFRYWMYAIVAFAIFLATLCVFWFPWLRNDYVFSTFLETVFVYMQFAVALAAVLFLIYAHVHTSGPVQLGSVAVAALVVAETWLFVPRVIFSGYNYWYRTETNQIAFFAVVWVLSILAAGIVYILETSLESGAWADRTVSDGTVINAAEG